MYNTDHPTAHEVYRDRQMCRFVYEYDPTDDGPECEIITRITAHHTTLDPVIAAHARHAIDNAATFDFGIKTGVLR